MVLLYNMYCSYTAMIYIAIVYCYYTDYYDIVVHRVLICKYYGSDYFYERQFIFFLSLCYYSEIHISSCLYKYPTADFQIANLRTF